ncbi:MAG: DUF2953 domain-containing protein [Eubacteriales bacterium]|nr:DUF2953 domain-containing protein [Eubacteriales bacterium]
MAVVLKILLGLPAALLVLALLLSWVRTGVEAVGVNGQVSVEARYGAIRIPVWPPPRHLRKKPEPAAPPPDEAAPREKKKKYVYSLNKEALDIGELLSLALTLLSELTDELRISRLRVRARIGTDDAARTGLLLGASAAISGILVPFLENTFEMHDYHVDVDADFESDHTEWAFTVYASLRPLRLVLVLLRHAGELYRTYKRLVKKEEAIAHE